MIFDLKNEYDLPKFEDKVKALLERKAVVELTEKKPRRTDSQNSYLYLCLSWFAHETGYSLEEVKLNYFKRYCNKEIFEEEFVNKRGVRITRLRSSRDLDTREMTLAIDRFRNWSAQNGIYLPSPDEKGNLLYIQKEIEKTKEFL